MFPAPLRYSATICTTSDDDTMGKNTNDQQKIELYIGEKKRIPFVEDVAEGGVRRSEESNDGDTPTATKIIPSRLHEDDDRPHNNCNKVERNGRL